MNPPGDVQTDAQVFCTLAHRLQKMYAGSKKERDKGFLAANFTYGAKPDHPEMVEVLKEINGFATEDITETLGRLAAWLREDFERVEIVQGTGPEPRSFDIWARR